MKILTFDTSFDRTYITLSEDLNLISSEIIENTQECYHSAFLIPKLAEILRKSNFFMQDIQAIGTNIGPGSFTGLRVSLTVARIMAQSLDIPLVGIPSLEIMSLSNDSGKKSFCTTDARRGKAYLGIYTNEGIIIKEPCALEYEKILELSAQEDYFFITDAKMGEKLGKSDFQIENRSSQNCDFGVNLAKLTFNYLSKSDKNNKKFKWHDVKPLYIQPPPIFGQV